LTEAALNHPARLAARRTSLILLLLTLTGFALRLPLLLRFPLREDEAIYGYWALHALYVDPLFLHVWPDKPPVFLWLLGAALQLWGHGPETAGAAMRIVSIMASTFTIPVLAACARRWWGEAAAVVAGLLVALNPFAISFAPTAYTDSLLVLAGSLALTLAVRRHWFWSGILLGITIMTKQQGLLFVPLVAACSLVPYTTHSWSQGSEHTQAHSGRVLYLGSLLRFATGLALVILPILYWDSLRWAVAPSPWDLGVTNVGGVAVLSPAAWVPRLAAWQELVGYLLASPWNWAAYIIVLVAAAVTSRRRRADGKAWQPAVLLAAWSTCFVLLHVGISVQAWDRYLLPLVVPLALLGGWTAAELIEIGQGQHHDTRLPIAPCTEWQRWLIAGAAAAVLLLLAGPAARAAQGGLPVGGDHGAYKGLDEALAAVDVPHTLLFHRELGWQARFALFDAIQSGDAELRYYPSAVYLADSAAKSPHRQRFVIVPDWAPLPDLRVQLAVRRLQAHMYRRSGHFTVYKIDELPLADASWRICSVPPFRTSGLRQLLPHEQNMISSADRGD
jgi:4-amino-4-deoxy-L-arabinose transferase-like glycosyltransferase